MSDINIVLGNRDDIHVAVEEKDINVEVPAGKDGRSLRPRGEWDASAAYAYLDLVSYEGSSYAALKAVPAGTLPTDTSYWMLSAEKGDPGTPEWGAITGNLSDQTDLQAALDAKADVITETASGSIASFSDGSPAPVTALSVAIEPVQDLHGYDAPWPAGGGANRWDEQWEVGAYNVLNGNKNNNATTRIRTKNPIPVLPETTYYKVAPADGFEYLVFYDSNMSYLSYANVGVGNTTFTTPVNAYFINTYTEADTYGTTYKHDMGINYPSTVTTYQPYSNICPISGHSTATVTRTGKNLFNPNAVESGYFYTDGSIRTSSVWVHEYIKINGGDTYTISGCNENSRTYHCWFDKNKTFISRFSAHANGTYTAPNNAMFMGINAIVMSNNDHDIDTLQIELGSVATAYEPYQAQQVTIDLDGTRYGGVLDVLTGMLTVTHGIVVFDGANNGNRVSYKYPNKYVYNLSAPSVGNTLIPTPNGNTVIGCLSDYFQNLTDNQAYDGSRNGFSTSTSGGFAKLSAPSIKAESQADMNAWLAQHPVTVVYPLATPIAVQLTPQQMQTLLGENHLWSDTGDMSVEYRADTKLYIDGKFSQLQALILEN